jgi:hypothetical protein
MFVGGREGEWILGLILQQLLFIARKSEVIFIYPEIKEVCLLFYMF